MKSKTARDKEIDTTVLSINSDRQLFKQQLLTLKKSNITNINELGKKKSISKNEEKKIYRLISSKIGVILKVTKRRYNKTKNSELHIRIELQL